MPALRSFSTIGIDLEAGPRVQTIFVFGFFSNVSAPPLSMPSSVSTNFEKVSEKEKQHNPDVKFEDAVTVYVKNDYIEKSQTEGKREL